MPSPHDKMMAALKKPMRSQLWPHKSLDLLEKALASIKENNEAVGGCDHSVGLCNCADIGLAEEIAAFLKEHGR